jgi:uncharacterized protein (TIGR03435 family)
MIRAIAVLTLCISGAVYGQSALPQRFEVDSVKLTPAGEFDGPSGVATGHGRLTANNVTLKRCIMGAFSVGPNQIAGGPPWLNSERFEIAARAEQPVDDDAVLMAMLQTLLAERFKLAFHRETRTIQTLVLEVAKNGPKLEQAEKGEANTNSSRGHLDARKITMERFAEVLSRQMDLPVVNRTALEGVFNLKLDWTPESADREGLSIFTSIQQQLGLRLRSEKTPVDILVIDHAEKPSEN